jgi:transcriptional regulator with XRE-family HTH domain/tetratricopeptide (TPR) repeat protein
MKSGSKADRGALRQQLLDRGCSLNDVAAEMRRRWRFRPRESYRHANGWSQDEVAARFTEVAARLAPGTRSAPMVGTRIGEYERWPQGGRRPSPYVLTVLAEVYGTEVRRLLDDADDRAMPEQDRAVLAALSTPPAPVAPVQPRDQSLQRRIPQPVHPRRPQPAPPVYDVPAPAPSPPPLVVSVPTRRLSALADAARMAVPTRRRGELATPASRAEEAELMAAAAATAAEFGEWAEASTVGPITLEQLNQDVREIARDYLTQPPNQLLRRTLDHRARVISLLEGRLRPAHARELYVLAGKLCGLAAWMVDDLGYRAQAGTHARIAGLCADLADHSALRGWVRATQSKLAYWDGRPRSSAQFAEDGLTTGVRDSGRVLLAGLAARGWAREGDRERATAALERMTAERAALEEADEVGGVWGFSEAQQYYLAGTAHLYLNQPEKAARAADRAVWLFEIAPSNERFYGAETLALLDSAIAHVELGDLAEAAQRLEPVLSLAPDKRVELICRRSTDLQRTLERSGRTVPGQMAALVENIPEFLSAAG